MATTPIDAVSLAAARKRYEGMTLEQIFEDLDDRNGPTQDPRSRMDMAQTIRDETLKNQARAAMENDQEFRAEYVRPDGQGQITDAVHARAFMLAGRCTVTLVSKRTGTRFTFRISKPRPKFEGEVDNGFRFVSVLNGPDNTSQYAYFGFIRPNGIFFHGGAKAKVREDAPSSKAFAWAWQKLASGVLPDSMEIWHSGRCGRCGRRLTVPSSIASGLGPECAGILEGGL